MAKESYVLTEAQIQALEKAKHEKEAHGEIETEHPGYLASEDALSYTDGCQGHRTGENDRSLI